MLFKREARQSSESSLSKKTKKESAAKVDLSVDALVKPAVELDGSAITLSIEQRSEDDAVSTEESINLEPCKNKQSATSKSIVPKLNNVDSVDAADDEDEIEKRRQSEMLKHFNKY